MRRLLTLLMFSICVLNSQINHQDKLVIKRKLGKSTVTVDFDGRVNETGFFHKHMDLGIAYPLQQSWIVELKYRAQYRTKEDTWSLEHRPQVQLIKNINSPSAKWQLRTRMDYRIREGKEDEINIKTKHPEFLDWKWVNIENLTDEVVSFKIHVYKQIQKELYKII